jgi:phage-related protein
MATFTYTADYGYQRETRPVTRRVQFLDGYEQRLAFGLNTLPQSYSLTFSNRDNTEADAIEAFLVARGGTEAFDWTPPQGGSAIKVVCDEPWERIPVAYNLNTINCRFRQVFEP